jgi:hypothetical protein
MCVQSWAAVDADGSRYLLSDFAGGLHLLVLAHADNRVAGLKVQTLGEWLMFIGGGGAGAIGCFKAHVQTSDNRVAGLKVQTLGECSVRIAVTRQERDRVNAHA